jgi:class 3 adenylate cyclase/tetratricopeptide (TPR) repeat protein
MSAPIDKIPDMSLCPGCGEANDERAKFCWNCATPLKQGAHPSRQVRKTVSVLFCDVTGSTSLGERLDPESTREIMGRYFAIATKVLERHGGTVEKFIGDAVMAVFGIPLVHEDDALRAVRAAAELREALRALDQQLDAEQGVVLSVRIGIDTGAVVSGDPSTGQTLVTGDAVNTAARLEAAAQPAEIVIGAATYGLVRDAVHAEPLEPMSLKGKAAPVLAYRLTSIIPGAAAHERRLDAPMVARERELARLRQAYEQAVSDRAPQLFTVLGPAGVGKSRLVAEFLSSVKDEATILPGRCLPYGEGITYWPVAEIVRLGAHIGEDDNGETALAKIRQVVAGLKDEEIIAERVASAIGLSVETAPQEELFWAVRRWLESIAAKGPVAIVFDDIHWAEPTLLDLIEHISDWSRDVPLLVLCVARQELLDARPVWGGGKLNATSVLLEPLGEEAIVGLIAHLPGGSTLPASMRSKIVEAADGNPLFVEEMLGMLRDDELLRDQYGEWLPEGVASVSVPPSISALLAARLERLGADERSVAERASVVGRVFDRIAVTELSPESERSTVNGSLLSLVRKQLLRPERSDLSGDDAFNFRHILIRDAAYDALPKADRAQLHERFADWLEEVTGDRLAEYEGIVGHHLEQAFHYRIELQPSDPAARRLAERAAERLGSAGRRAVQRADLVAAINLLQRAVALIGANAAVTTGILPVLIEALIETGRFADAERELAQAPPAIGLPDSAPVYARLQLHAVWLGWLTHPESFEFETVTAGIIQALEATGDQEGLAQAWRIRGLIHWIRVEAADAVKCWQLSLEYAKKSGSAHDTMLAIEWLTTCTFFSGMPAAEGMEVCQTLLPHARDHPAVEASILVAEAGLKAMQGHFAIARSLKARAIERMSEFGLGFFAAGTAAQVFGTIEFLADDPVAAEAELRRGYEVLGRMGEQSLRSTTAALLAEAVWRTGRAEEAWELTQIAQATGALDDVATQVSWRSVRAKILAARGQADAAVSLAAEAVDQVGRAEGFIFTPDALVDQAEVLVTTGRGAEALPGLRRALSLYQSKGNVVSTGKTLALIQRLSGE